MSSNPQREEISPLDRQNVVALDRPGPSPARQILVEIIQTISLALLLFLAINLVSARIRVDGESMEPNFQDGNYVVVNRLAYRIGEIERGDVVVFLYPLNREEDLIKRVIGLTGDRISMAEGQIYVNGVALQEDYLREPPRGSMQELIVPPGHVFVMGDNRNDSSDSRVWGPLAVEDIIGKAVFRYFPFNLMGLVVHPDLSLASP